MSLKYENMHAFRRARHEGATGRFKNLEAKDKHELDMNKVRLYRKGRICHLSRYLKGIMCHLRVEYTILRVEYAIVRVEYAKEKHELDMNKVCVVSSL